MAEFVENPEVNTPEIIGAAIFGTYSNAPWSVLAPFGRLTPPASTGTAARFRPASIPAPLDCSWKSKGAVKALTNIGSAPIEFVPTVRPAVPPDSIVLTP